MHTPLLTYRHAEGEDGEELIPGLASDLPEVSDDGRTYRLHLRDGLEYSDATPVRASDFERAVRRVLTLQPLDAPLYEEIAGAREFVAAGDPEGDVTGITADDESGEIRIELTRRDASFANLLALVSSAPLPASTDPASASSRIPGVGPYEIDLEPDSSSSDGMRLVRSRGFPDLDIPDIPTGNLASIEIKVGGDAADRAQGVLDGKLDYMQDSPPRRLEATLREQADDRFREHPSSSTLYFSLDKSRAPFDDPLVREAANTAIDQTALAHVGEDQSIPGCSFLPPAAPGYDEVLDHAGCPYGDPARPPRVGRARDLIRQAGARGEPVTVAASGEPHGRELAGELADSLDGIGLDARITSAAGGATGQAVARESISALPNPVGALTLLTVPAPGETAGQASFDPFVARELERLRAASDPSVAASELRALDRYLVSPPQSYVAVFGHPRATTLLSERIDPGTAVYNPVFGNDYSSWSLRSGE